MSRHDCEGKIEREEEEADEEDAWEGGGRKDGISKEKEDCKEN